MQRYSRYLPVILLMLAAAGCQTSSRLGPNGTPKGTLVHVVVIWMYDRGDETARNEMFKAGQDLEKIPGVLSVVGGRVLPSDRPKVDNSFDVAFVLKFRDEADLRRYTDDPTHIRIKKDVLDRYAKDVKVYDFIAE